MDSDGDGIGDLNGIRSKLDYVEDLGVDVLWLSPIFQSPNVDNGYDVSDYREIMTDFGTMEDFDALLTDVHDRGMRLILDLVPNHTSDQHPWFLDARSSKDSRYRDYYIWKNEANNWPSIFGGSAWQKTDETGEYYLHLFTKEQPDLNWENPEVRREIYEMMRFWLDKGIDGFRIDVITMISKDLAFPDVGADDFENIINEQYANGPRIHEFLQEMNQEVMAHYDMMTVGEGPGISTDNVLDYVGSDRGELNMIYHFEHLSLGHGSEGRLNPVPWKLSEFKDVFVSWENALDGKGWGTVALGNHDFARIVSRFGDDSTYRIESAKLLGTVLLTHPGTPYLYQGDELGMTNTPIASIGDVQDVWALNSWEIARKAGQDMDQVLKRIAQEGRDNARTPMLWDDSGNAGFTSGSPWIGVNPNHDQINASQQREDEASVYNYYKALITFRKTHQTLVYGRYECLDPDDETTYSYTRSDSDGTYLIVLNMSSQSVAIPAVEGRWQMRINNYLGENPTWELRPWEAKIFQSKT